MRFTAFPEIKLNPGMRDMYLYPLFLGRGTLACRWVKPPALTQSAYLSLWVHGKKWREAVSIRGLLDPLPQSRHP
jgi:hypothetical protein